MRGDNFMSESEDTSKGVRWVGRRKTRYTISRKSKWAMVTPPTSFSGYGHTFRVMSTFSQFLVFFYCSTGICMILSRLITRNDAPFPKFRVFPILSLLWLFLVLFLPVFVIFQWESQWNDNQKTQATEEFGRYKGFALVMEALESIRYMLRNLLRLVPRHLQPEGSMQTRIFPGMFW